MNSFERAIAAVLRDVAATTDLNVVIEHGVEDEESTWLRAGVGDAVTGTTIYTGSSDAAVLEAVAVLVHDVVIEEQWARASNWPMCPQHRSSHPLRTLLEAPAVWWVCPESGDRIAEVGSLRL